MQCTRRPGACIYRPLYRKPPPSFELCEKVAKALGLNSEEKSEILLAAMNQRFSESDQGFFDLVGHLKVQEIIKSKFGVLFEDEKIVDLLYDPEVVNLLEKLHDLPHSKKIQATQMINTVLKGLE